VNTRFNGSSVAYLGSMSNSITIVRTKTSRQNVMMAVSLMCTRATSHYITLANCRSAHSCLCPYRTPFSWRPETLTSIGCYTATDLLKYTFMPLLLRKWYAARLLDLGQFKWENCKTQLISHLEFDIPIHMLFLLQISTHLQDLVAKPTPLHIYLTNLTCFCRFRVARGQIYLS
jgi:hypothetical protein